MPATQPPSPVLDELQALVRRIGLTQPERAAALQNHGEIILDICDGPEAPLREILQRLGDRWSTLLLVALSTGSYRHAELRRVINVLSRLGGNIAISQRMLTLRLRALERNGLVARTLGTGKAPAVEYRLTPLGEGLVQQLTLLRRWCTDHADAIRTAQQVFDATAEDTPPNGITHATAQRVRPLPG